MNYHGNYCGPGWSAGAYQTSVCDADVPPVDSFDGTCREHDCRYALGMDRKKADLEFYERNIGRGAKRSIAAIAVGAQGALRRAAAVKPGHLKNLSLSLSKLTTHSPSATFIHSPPRMVQKKKPKPPKSRKTAALETFAPAAISRKVAMAAPCLTAGPRGQTVVSHRELLFTVANTTSFSVTPYAVNPGLSLFPWLSTVANNYQQYRWRRLRFVWSTAAPTSTGGKALLAWSNNAADPVPVSKAAMYTTTPNVENAVWENFALAVPTDSKLYYTRPYSLSVPATGGSNFALTSGQDVKTTDMGQLFVATDLGTGTTNVAEVYVEYTVELLHPHATALAATELSFTGASYTNLFPASTLTVSGARGLAMDSPAANSFFLNSSGTYLISVFMTGTGITASTMTLTQTSNYGQGTITQVFTPYGAVISSSYAVFSYVATVTVNSQGFIELVFSGMTAGSSMTNRVFATLLPSGTYA